MRRLQLLTAGSAIVLLLFNRAASANGMDAAYERQLMQYARAILEETVLGSDTKTSELSAQPLHTGLFVTLVKNNKVRGCYGSLTPQGDSLPAQLKEYIIGAATQDFRHDPVRAYELSQIVIILTFINGIEPASSLFEIDPKTDGVLVRNGDRAAVLLPGEARSASWQIEEAKRQAGIRQGEPSELFKIHTATLYER